MTARTPAERQRLHRERLRAARAHQWREELPGRWHPFLEAWAARGLRLPPTESQLQLLTPYAELPRGPHQLGVVLGHVRRARARHSPTTYRLVAAVLRAIEQFRRLVMAAREAFDRPLDLSDPRARRERGELTKGRERPPPRRSRKASDGQLPVEPPPAGETLTDALRRHGHQEEDWTWRKRSR